MAGGSCCGGGARKVILGGKHVEPLTAAASPAYSVKLPSGEIVVADDDGSPLSYLSARRISLKRGGSIRTRR